MERVVQREEELAVAVWGDAVFLARVVFHHNGDMSFAFADPQPAPALLEEVLEGEFGGLDAVPPRAWVPVPAGSAPARRVREHGTRWRPMAEGFEVA